MYLVSIVVGNIQSNNIYKNLGIEKNYEEAFKKLRKEISKHLMEEPKHYREITTDGVFYYDFGSWTYFGRIERVKEND